MVQILYKMFDEEGKFSFFFCWVTPCMKHPWIWSQDCKAEIFQGIWCPLVVNRCLSFVVKPWFKHKWYQTNLWLFQALLTKLWWGAMTTDTAISKLVLSFFFPPLIWTNMIKFRWSISCYLPQFVLCRVDVPYVFFVEYTLSCVLLSDEELDNRNGREQFAELDSLDTEKALLLTDDDDPLWVCNQIILKLLLNNLKIVFYYHALYIGN